MRKAKFIIFLFLFILVMPIFSIIALSFKNTGGEIFKWYSIILDDKDFINSFLLSFFVSICTAVLTLLISFIFSLSWFDKKQRIVVLFLILVLGLLPPDIMALGISRTSQLFGFYSSNLVFLIFGLTLYCLPFGILIFWSRFYFIEDSIITAAKDLGVKKFYIVTKIILPLSEISVITCMTLSFLLALNEYPRTYYLSGSRQLISEFINGKLSSGTNGSIYAGGSIVTGITVLLICILAILNYFISQRKKIIKIS